MPRLLDHRGEPISVVDKAQAKGSEAQVRAWNSFVSAVGGLEQPVLSRTRDPFNNHVWVYAAVMAIASNISQVPFKVYTEDAQTPVRPNIDRTPRSGRRRRALHMFHNQKMRKCGLRIRGAVENFDHPIASVLHTPNPLMSQSQLFEMISMWMALRGACFLLKTNESGQAVGPGQMPTYLWPMNPDLFDPIVEGGEFIGWRIQIPYNDPATGKRGGSMIEVARDEVIWFRYPDPKDPLGWVSPITAAASGIMMDMAAIAYNRAVLMNGAKPGGLLLHEDDVDEKEEEKLRKYWAGRHEGPQNANKIAILTGAFKYVDIGLGPKDMQYLEQRKWDREEIFAALRVPKSALSLTEGNNYATQLSQDRNFWTINLIPQMLMYEGVLDRSLFYGETDNTFGAFDYSSVEALRAGLDERVKVAVQLSGPQLRVPPRLAFEIVGIEVPDYETCDIAMVSGSMMTPQQAMDSADAGIVAANNPPNGSDPNNPGSQNPATGQPEGDQSNPDRNPRPSDEEVPSEPQN